MQEAAGMATFVSEAAEVGWAIQWIRKPNCSGGLRNCFDGEVHDGGAPAAGESKIGYGKIARNGEERMLRD